MSLESAGSDVDPNRSLAQPEGSTHGKSTAGSMTGRSWLRRIALAPMEADRRRGLLVAGGLRIPCALGRAGIVHLKREGDGATPVGRLALLAAFYRADRLRRPATALPLFPLRPEIGWCDDPADRRYNRAVRLPFKASHERLWRSDHLYDVVVILDYNLARPRRGAGSAIFLHVASPGFSPTEGCVAISLPAMLRLLARSGPGTFLDVA
jgi:L,D-peptidoglycan transpeptidase YkuD (ErfK/YbiS/YcfS/YnhG family)